MAPLAIACLPPIVIFPLIIVVVESLKHVQLFAQQARLPLSLTISWSSFRFIFIESVMLSNHLILCCPFLLLPSFFPSIRVFFSESALCIKWPKYWSFSLSISPSNEYSGLILLELTGLITLQSTELSRIFSSTTLWKHKFFSARPPLWSNFHTRTWHWKNHTFD